MNRFCFFAALIAALFFLSCNSHHEQDGEKLNLTVTSPLKKDQEIIRNYVSQIRSIQHIEVRALEKGYLQEIYVDEGVQVKKDQPLFRIMPNLYQAEYGKAQAEAEFAEIEYENTKKLKEKNIVANSELNLAKAKLDGANANLKLAKTHLDFTDIKAPFDGIVGRFQARKGSLLEEGELLTTLSDNHEMWVYFNLPEVEYLNYKRTAKDDKIIKAKLRMANGEVYENTGIITAIEADFNNETGNIAFRATFPNPDGILRHGQTGNVLLSTTVKDAIIIPQKASFEILDKRYVFIVDHENKVKSRLITVLHDMPDIFVVEGLNENEKILIDGMRKVRDGDEIEPNFQEPETVFSNLKEYSE